MVPLGLKMCLDKVLPRRFVAEDDDTGEGRNARIVEDLTGGLYRIKVRHYSPRGTGSYQISVRT